MNVAMQIYKKIIPVCLSLAMLASCSDEPRRNTGRIYMPDMTYSRAYETYAVTPEQREELLKKGKFIRIHRSFIVAKSRIDAFTATEVEVAGKEIPIGRSYKEHVLSNLN